MRPKRRKSYGDVDPEISHTTLSRSCQATVAPTTNSGWGSNFCAQDRNETSEASGLVADRIGGPQCGVAATG